MVGELVLNLFTRLYNSEKTISVCCSPRSGSTWLAECLVEKGHLDWVDEPLRLVGGEDSFLYKAGFRARTFIEEDDYRSERASKIQQILEDVLIGRVGYLNKSRVLKRRLLLKFVRINRLLPFISTLFPKQKFILLIRNPCAVIASQLNMHGNVNNLWSAVTQPAPDIPQAFLPLVNKINPKEPHQILAVNWAIDQVIAVREAEKNPFVFTVFYEHLIDDSEKNIAKLCEFANIKNPPLADRPSSTASEDFNKQSQMIKWQEKLTAEQISDIYEICEILGASFYGTDHLPKANDALIKSTEPKFNALVKQAS
ncbi:sulfotransferase [Alteromonas ponticola]|uniref:Sulfotransferase n=1 Tax=Alteromonas ponticola TaxID=2720613 RepID=A0ABX1R0B7_9ALTE|nr:sulfotransferase [Alteromonas ponticola]NMH59056.1 sulfotransferase [Alteromonas ponticola]